MVKIVRKLTDMLSCLDIDEEPLGYVEGTLDLYISHIDPHQLLMNGIIWVMNIRSPTVAYILGELHSHIQEYCTNGDETKAYRPTDNENCFVYFEGDFSAFFWKMLADKLIMCCRCLAQGSL